MTDDFLIQVNQVSKCYKVADSPARKVLNAIIPSFNAGVRDFWALRDVDFKVGRGEAVAIIGRNGSGKSTLLEIITGTLKPTSGRVSTQGRIAALLQLGSGFNPEFTGRENVILNGLLLGLTRAEIQAKFIDIVEFADIGDDVIEQPVKSYSSGMLVRLAFSVQVALDPDILIVDEALSVGDFFFKQKCAERMRALRETGTTILFVSHSMASVREICDRAIVLEEGHKIFEGDSQTAVRTYLGRGVKTKPANLIQPNSDVIQHSAWQDIVASEDCMLWQHKAPDQQAVFGGVLGVAILCDEDADPMMLNIGESRTLRLYFKTPSQVQSFIEFAIRDKFSKQLYSTNSLALGNAPFKEAVEGIIVFDLKLDLLLSQGQYSFEFKLNEFSDTINESDSVMIDRTGPMGPLDIRKKTDEYLPFRGGVGLPVKAQIEIIN